VDNLSLAHFSTHSISSHLLIYFYSLHMKILSIPYYLLETKIIIIILIYLLYHDYMYQRYHYQIDSLMNLYDDYHSLTHYVIMIFNYRYQMHLDLKVLFYLFYDLFHHI